MIRPVSHNMEVKPLEYLTYGRYNGMPLYNYSVI